MAWPRSLVRRTINTVMLLRTPTFIVAAIAGLVAASSAVLTAEGLGSDHSTTLSRDFQTLLGGLGLGPRVNLAGCATCFDPRAEERCWGSGPLLTGLTYCPEHTLSVFAHQQLPGPLGSKQPRARNHDSGEMHGSTTRGASGPPYRTKEPLAERVDHLTRSRNRDSAAMDDGPPPE